MMTDTAIEAVASLVTALNVWVVFNEHGDPVEIGKTEQIASGRTISSYFPQLKFRQGWTIHPAKLVIEESPPPKEPTPCPTPPKDKS